MLGWLTGWFTSWKKTREIKKHFPDTYRELCRKDLSPEDFVDAPRPGTPPKYFDPE